MNGHREQQPRTYQPPGDVSLLGVLENRRGSCDEREQRQPSRAGPQQRGVRRVFVPAHPPRVEQQQAGDAEAERDGLTRFPAQHEPAGREGRYDKRAGAQQTAGLAQTEREQHDAFRRKQHGELLPAELGYQSERDEQQALREIGRAHGRFLREPRPREGRQPEQHRAEAEAELPELPAARCGHRERDEGEERGVVRAEEGRAAFVREQIALRKEGCRREASPVAREEKGRQQEVLRRRTQQPVAVVEEAPEREAAIGCDEAREREMRPAVAHEEEDGGHGEHEVRVKREGAHARDDGSVVTEPERKERERLGLLPVREPHDEARPRQQQRAVERGAADDA